MIKRYFLTGLALLLPVVLTILIVVFFINLLTKPFLDMAENVLRHYELLGKPILFLAPDQVQQFIAKIFIIVTLIAVTLIIGLLAQIVATRYFIRLGDTIIHRIPVINKIYKSAQDVVTTLLAENRQTFSKVVLVPFPHDKAYSIGMITNESLSIEKDVEHAGLVSVFLPATPNPTMGFILMVQRERLIFTDMKVEDALKSIISCGVMIGEITPLRTPER